MGRDGATHVLLKLLEDVNETGRELDAMGNREGETHGLAGSMIRVLP